MNVRLSIACVVLAALHAPGLRADEQEQYFSKNVAPILIRRCLECHGSDGKGGLDLRSSARALAGGENGRVIEPGKPAESRLIEYITSGEMPPQKPLPREEVAVLTAWVRQGAWFPEQRLDAFSLTSAHRAGYDWWSLQPVRSPRVPDVKRSDAAPTEIDRFLLASLESRQLTFNPSTDRASYIRRLTYDLLGLAPSYEELQRFVADDRADAYEQLVDRLLESPQYGERWGRHWLDVVRFAESNGFERDRIRRNFWPYRDYVIRAFNEDKPYDQFILEQLAGDAIEPDRAENRIALGFLAAGPKNDVDTVSPLEQMQTRQDELDEFVTAAGSTFLGLTLGCARCHDHKFDPIPVGDYYALTAVFSECRHADSVSLASPEERRRHDDLASTLRVRGEALRNRQREINDAGWLRRLARTEAEARAKAAGDPAKPPALSLPAVGVRCNGDPFPATRARFVRFTILRANSGEPCLDELEIFGPAGKQNLALASAGGKATASSLLPGFPIHQIAHLNDGEHGNSHSWISNAATGWAQIELPEEKEIDRDVWGRDRDGRFSDRVPIDYRIELSRDGKNWTGISDSSQRPAVDAPDPQPVDAQLMELLSADERQNYNELERQIQTAQKELQQLPSLPTVYSINDGAGLGSTPILKRGDVRAPGELVAAHALSAIRGLQGEFSAGSGAERRLKFARWIAHPDNPLTSRVIVNRIWHYHFGQGIVDTPSDFGFKGSAPSHPELLDFLAADFVAHGWKIKRLQRQIVLSAAYHQSSDFRLEAAQQDAGNRLLWRYAPRRLEAEAIRDLMLQFSGKLDCTLGGPSFKLFVYRDGNVPDYQIVELPGPETWRRSVYGYNIRTFHSPLISTFDCPDPSVSTPNRTQSTTPLQALSLLNNPFVVQQAGFLAQRIQSTAGTDLPAQVAAAYRIVFLRNPSEAEQSRAAVFVAKHGLAGWCRVLFNSNEFLYVD